MKHSILRKLMLIAVLLTSSQAFAHDFEVNGIYYNITSESDLTVEVASGNTKYTGSILIPENVTCSGSTYSVTSILREAFYFCSNLTSVTIPNSVTSIGDNAFYGCSGLISVTMPNSITNIADATFSKCINLTSITIPNSVLNISPYVFYQCTRLTSVIIPNSVTNIGLYAFYECTELTCITIGNSVTNIEDCAFIGCKRLTEVICKSTTPPTVNSYIFVGVSTTATLYVPVGSKEAYANATGWKDFTNIEELEFTEETTITINDASNQGSVSFNYEEGKTFEFTVSPVTGYIVNTVLVNGDICEAENGTYKIESVSGETTISVSYEIDPETGVNTLSSNNLKVYGYENNLTLSGTEYGDTISIYDLNGALIQTHISTGLSNNISLNNGIYIVKVNGKSFKVIL